MQKLFNPTGIIKSENTIIEMITRTLIKVVLATLGLSLLFVVKTNMAEDTVDELTAIPAFPGAQGGGKYTTGGRGGKVLKVTNLNNSGPGSLRHAIETSGPRTIVFDVSGTIELQSRIRVKQGDLTIAGQTAPGDGICISGHEFRLSADNIIIRFIRFRPGDTAKQENDAITGMNNKNIIIDHCSMSWSTDETVSLYDNENFTLQWCLISESLNNSVHSKGPHGYGGIWGGKNASFLNNVLAHHSSRNPRLQGTREQQVAGMEKVEIINNLIYNWGNKAIYGGENGLYNIINNIFIPGPATDDIDEILEPYKPFGKFFLKGNVFYSNGEFTDSGWENVTLPAKQLSSVKVSKPFEFPYSSFHENASLVFEPLLANVGASLFRDTVDQRIIHEIRTEAYTYGQAGIIDSQKQVGGWPVLKSEQAPVDSDGDGIPDHWEQTRNLDPNDPADGSKYTLGKKYTNLEVYLNSLVEN